MKWNYSIVNCNVFCYIWNSYPSSPLITMYIYIYMLKSLRHYHANTPTDTWSLTWNLKMMVSKRNLRISGGWFSGSMLNFRGIASQWKKTQPTKFAPKILVLQRDPNFSSIQQSYLSGPNPSRKPPLETALDRGALEEVLKKIRKPEVAAATRGWTPSLNWVVFFWLEAGGSWMITW